MLNREERLKIQAKLPVNKKKGYTLIQEKLPDLTRVQISRAFTEDNRYKPEVIQAAMQVILEFEETENTIKNQIAKL
jgi:hypothetical protein